MRQPKKILTFFPKTIPDKKNKVISQPIPKSIDFWINEKNEISKEDMDEMVKSRVKTSKLEIFFMRNFLDKLGIKYIWQFYTPAKFVYDFAILTKDGTQITALLEVDGDYFHANPKTNKSGFLYESQKLQIKRDRQKDEWSNLNGFVLLRFWEYDIKNNSKDVLKELEKRFYTRFDKN